MSTKLSKRPDGSACDSNFIFYLFSGDAGANPDVRDPGRLVVESAAVLLRLGCGRGRRRAEQAEEKVSQGRGQSQCCQMAIFDP